MIHCFKALFLCQKGENPNRILSFLVASLRLAMIRFAQTGRREYPLPSGTAPCETKVVRFWAVWVLRRKDRVPERGIAIERNTSAN